MKTALSNTEKVYGGKPWLMMSALAKRTDEQRRQLLDGMERYNAEYGAWYDAFPLSEFE